ncbi:DUF1090 domain-containing protein [Burkholderia pyrrocinia]|uniref:DUF1090 domain-containing protein n=1 Tax=Burkholderia pyrrocinia TaxID=60550 RepID=A0A2Z5N2Z2_BURPY|nr:DUF1090 family protein [Burkholderia pyrrocinia]AXF23895.1 DUF1090 domain-containing protein [Burkholderia pyrrocinia]
MKNTLIAITLPIAQLASSAALADTQDCATRIRALQTQIDYAKQHGNAQQAMHQQAALAQIRANCTDAGQLARAEREVRDEQRDVEKAQDEVREAESDVQQAEARGDAGKIAKAKRKLADKQHKLRDATRELHDAAASRDALKR